MKCGPMSDDLFLTAPWRSSWQTLRRPDRDARISDDAIKTLRESRYFSSMIPAQFGGGGASLLECAAMQRRIGQVDAGLAAGLTKDLTDERDSVRLEHRSEV
jgi:alkylation response protein AidB-like acyl-CoA dehydrogenase